jgi:hypothetical protein
VTNSKLIRDVNSGHLPIYISNWDRVINFRSHDLIPNLVGLYIPSHLPTNRDRVVNLGHLPIYISNKDRVVNSGHLPIYYIGLKLTFSFLFLFPNSVGWNSNRGRVKIINKSHVT